MKVVSYGLAIIIACSHLLAQAEDHVHAHSEEHSHTEEHRHTDAHAAHGPEDAQHGLVISDARAKATIPGIKVSLGYMKLTNHSDANIRLVAAKTPAAEHVEYHSMKVQNNKMSMRMVKYIDIPAHKSVVFGPKGYHLMFMSIQSPFVEGQSFPLTLIADDGAQYSVSMLVQNLDGHSSAHSHSH